MAKYRGRTTILKAADAPVLVVDDDPAIRQVIQWALEDQGLPVETAADGREALDRARQHRPALVLLDLGLPIVDGTRVSAELRATHGESLPIVIVSADRRVSEKAVQLRAQDYLAKPFDIEDLLTSVQHALEGCPGR